MQTFAKWLNIEVEWEGSGKTVKKQSVHANTALKDIKKNESNFRRLRWLVPLVLEFQPSIDLDWHSSLYPILSKSTDYGSADARGGQTTQLKLGLNHGRSCLPYRCSSCELSCRSLYPTIDQQCRHDLFILVLYGLVGFLDDFLKVFRKINEAWILSKSLLQLLGGDFLPLYERGGDMLSVFGYQVHLGIFYIFFAFSG